MSEYGYDNLPDELTVQALPDYLFGDALAALEQAVNSDSVLVREAKAAYVYDRKGCMEVNSLGGVRSPSYTSDSDDVVLQVTVRIPHPQGRQELDETLLLETLVKEHRLKAYRKRLEDEIAAEEAAAVKAKQTAEQKREQLRVLNGETK